tara:strand:- start:1276 stop:1899 length:624 start_codon:yes stop_codon:yes gene_type:complete
MEKETRSLQNKIEVRNGDNEDINIVMGYAAVFDEESEVLGFGFTEVIDRNAFSNTNFSEARALFNHDPNYVLGSVKAGTLRLSVDERGLKYEIDMPSSSTINDLVGEPIKRGDINQSSFAFTLRYNSKEPYERWERGKDKDKRTLLDIAEVFDVSPVTYPAYKQTTVSARSYNDFKEQQDKLKTVTDQRQAHVKTLLRSNKNKSYES